jgi:hypothetical protein
VLLFITFHIHNFNIFLERFTERRRQICRTPASCPGCTGLESRSGDLVNVFREFSQFLQENVGIAPQIVARSLPSICFPIRSLMLVVQFNAT